MIVFGGTFGAVLLQFPLPIILTSLKRLAHVFLHTQQDPQELIREITGYERARKEGYCFT